MNGLSYKQRDSLVINSVDSIEGATKRLSELNNLNLIYSKETIKTLNKHLYNSKS